MPTGSLSSSATKTCDSEVEVDQLLLLVVLFQSENPILIGLYRFLMFASRLIIIVSPVFVLDFYSFDSPIYFVNLLAALILLGKCAWMTRLQGRLTAD